VRCPRLLVSGKEGRWTSEASSRMQGHERFRHVAGSPDRRAAHWSWSHRRSPVHERTVLERSAENVEDLLLNAVGVDLVLEDT
jgi:hypothetical protein